MGAWGLGFFESDHDRDAISYLYEPAGLEALEAKAKERAKARKGKGSPPDSKGGPYLDIFAGFCDDVELVRDHLDSGALPKLIDHVKAEIARKSDPDEDEYLFVLLGVCAMSLGCKLPADFKAELIKKYRFVGLMRDAMFQMQVALGDGIGGYQDGEPFDFALKGLLQEARSGISLDNDRLYPNMLNVSAPFGFMQKPEHRRALAKQYSSDVCGGCGSKERKDGKPLLVCGNCKITKYCGKVCQQARFKKHKQVCKGTNDTE